MWWKRLLALFGLGGPPPGHIRVQDASTGELRWVDPSTLQVAPPRRELSAEELARIQQLHERLAPLDGWPVETRVDLFSRDLHPAKEIEICEHIADLCDQAYRELGPLSTVQKREIYGVLMAYTGVPADEVLKHYTPQNITIEQARHVLSL